MLATHGFRMPLFFLLSGFFTVLLWRRRGLHNLLWHRTRRLLFPFVLAIILIAPTVTWVSDRAIEAQLSDEADINGAVYLGSEGAVRAIIDAGLDSNAPGSDGNTPIYAAAITGDVAMVELLLGLGADPNVPNADGMPVDVAAYFGHREAAEALVAGGSYDPRAAGGPPCSRLALAARPLARAARTQAGGSRTELSPAGLRRPATGQQEEGIAPALALDLVDVANLYALEAGLGGQLDQHAALEAVVMDARLVGIVERAVLLVQVHEADAPARHQRLADGAERGGRVLHMVQHQQRDDQVEGRARRRLVAGEVEDDGRGIDDAFRFDPVARLFDHAL